MTGKKGANGFTKGTITGHTESTKQRLSQTASGKTHTPEARAVLSEKQKLAHSEGRAWNIGMNRWRKTPSYAEAFFARVIENEFTDKMHEREVWFKRYVLDFVWPHLKKVIEIDGKQHLQPEQKARDIAKDKLLAEHGYSVLRITWQDMSNDPGKWIQIARVFIDG